MERPSGVSSGSEASCAASASSLSLTPGRGTNSDACRLPSVMVPVLSSSSVSTSPAASTERPDMASTLKRTSRSMPAMPMAESSAPMVVGMRVTNSATSTMTGDLAAGIRRKAWDARHREDEDDRHAGQEDVQRDFIRRFLPLGAFDKPDHAVEEGRALRGGDAHDDPVGDHHRAARHRRAVAAELADNRRGFAGDRGFVHRGHAFDDVAIGWDQVARLDKDDVALFQLDRRDRRDLVMVARIGKLLGDHIRLGRPQARGLRLAAALGHRFREVREQHREPEPQDDLEREAVMAGAGDDIADEKHRRERRDNLDDEHHGVLHHQPRIELFEGIADGRDQDLGIGDRCRRRPLGFRNRRHSVRSLKLKRFGRPSSRDARQWVLAKWLGRRSARQRSGSRR